MKLLLGFLRFIFDCRHRHQSRVFTIKHRTYRVCFDCGREFDLLDSHTRYGQTFCRIPDRTNPNPQPAPLKLREFSGTPQSYRTKFSSEL